MFFINSPTVQLAAFAANLRFDAIPGTVVRKTEYLLVDWLGSAVAGHGARAVESITRFAMAMGAQVGPSEVIVNRARTSPYLAAMANAAASNTSVRLEQRAGRFCRISGVEPKRVARSAC
ncbi:MAG TPA: hypothetical protein DCP03_08630, partial [Polaromonas sp.]|nr:hypothetical protein [Polaromonas sp.]